MTPQEKRALWGAYPEVWEMFEESNGITLEDDAAWKRLIDRAYRIGDAHGRSPVIRELLIATVGDLDKIARKRKGRG